GRRPVARRRARPRRGGRGGAARGLAVAGQPACRPGGQARTVAAAAAAEARPRMNARSAGSVATTLRPMREEDLDLVMEIERSAYPFPWTRGIFRDCVRADYPAWIHAQDGMAIGYAVISVAAGEAHILNLCTAPEAQGQGHGRALLRQVLRQARGRGAHRVFLEVRPSKPHALALAPGEGLSAIGHRHTA